MSSNTSGVIIAWVTLFSAFGVVAFLIWLLFIIRKRRPKTVPVPKPPRQIVEIKHTCQGCGYVWHKGMGVADKLQNLGERLQNMGQRQINSANQLSNTSRDLLCCSGCVPALFIPNAPQQVPIKDLNRCPNCNSLIIKKEEVVYDIPQ
jgi:hypothetical protein